MAKPKAPIPDEADDDEDPAPEPDEDAAWSKASPRLKGIFKEAIDEWSAEHAQADTTGDGAAAAGRGTNGGAGGTGDTAAKRTRTPARPSGGSILDVLLGR